MTETSNVYENKNICIKIAEILLSFGADVNNFHHGKTLLMSFCGMSMNLENVHLEMYFDVITFLIEHGADKNLKSKTNGMSAIDLANNHCAAAQVKKILN